MNIITINSILGILAGVKIMKIDDKEAKGVLLKDYLALRKASKGANEEKDEIIRKFQEDWRDELADVQAFRNDSNPVIGHDAFLNAEKDANKAIQTTLLREVELDLAPVPFAALEGVSGDITLEQVAILKENGIIV